MEMKLDSIQFEAIKLCLNKDNRIVAVTGPAGTGKTTIIKKVCEQLEKDEISFALAAPTGKAARRITEATGYDAVTIHRLLEYPRPGERDPETGKALDTTTPKRGIDLPLAYSVIVVDEYMMVNYELDRNLIDALGRGARLLCFGDIHQLPPIESQSGAATEEAAFLRHIKRASIQLEHVYRQGEGSGILANANKIRKGSVPSKTDDFQIHFTTDPIKVLKSYVVRVREEQGIDFGSLEHQIIVPTRKTWIGTIAANPVLRRALNPNPEFDINLPRHTWDSKNPCRVGIGDKIVCTENTYDMRDYDVRYTHFNTNGEPVVSTYIDVPASKYMLNGETGIVIDILADGGLHVDMGDRVVEIPEHYAEYHWKSGDVYNVDPRKRIELGYALTTHKCQGSEYKRIIYLMNKSARFMVNKRNFYTAVTRAKEHVIVLTDPICMTHGIKPPKEWSPKK